MVSLVSVFVYHAVGLANAAQGTGLKKRLGDKDCAHRDCKATTHGRASFRSPSFDTEFVLRAPRDFNFLCKPILWHIHMTRYYLQCGKMVQTGGGGTYITSTSRVALSLQSFLLPKPLLPITD
jgi:hypothetical protein